MTVEDSVECVDEEVVLTILLVFVSAIVTGSEVGVDSVLGVVRTLPLVIISAIVEYSEIIGSDSAIDTEVVIGIILLVLVSMSVGEFVVCIDEEVAVIFGSSVDVIGSVLEFVKILFDLVTVVVDGF